MWFHLRRGKSEAVRLKLYSETYNSASGEQNNLKYIKTPNRKFHLRRGDSLSFDCRPVPGCLLYTPNSYSSLTTRGSYVNFVTRRLLRGSERATGEGKHQQM